VYAAVPSVPPAPHVNVPALFTPLPPRVDERIAEREAAVPVVFWLNVGKEVRDAAEPFVVNIFPVPDSSLNTPSNCADVVAAKTPKLLDDNATVPDRSGSVYVLAAVKSAFVIVPSKRAAPNAAAVTAIRS